ncbi:MAG: SusD/RagB family nutrient-binding outer membrane lipoprotein [Bacteroidaceae bacterium]|nr:SusD/RagB family nutrient-binding outer membrane lipoprotein [Bacteroidales bacterium]MBQ9523873.1 SusD/RagB family nutrient-binding outer membrane lipoprotein [Bacteroidaceae bacterium]
MKKIYSLILGILILTAFASCSVDSFNSKYYDPAKTTVVTCDKLMTGAFMSGNGYTFNAYWRMYTWDNYFGKLAQTIGPNVDSGSMYFINDGYANDRWNGFYDILRQYRVMQKQYESETAEDQKEDRIFLALTEVFLYDHLSQIVDIFGPVPFHEAGFLGVTGNLASSYPAYDSDVDLYKEMLTNLDALYTEIGSLNNSISGMTKTKLVAQDYFNGGDLTVWQQYCNALLLRLGVHVSAQGSLVAEGKAAVAKAVTRALPLTWDESIKAVSDFDGFNYWENFRDSFKDINNTSSQVMIDAFQVTGADDPRLALIYFPDENGVFTGKSMDETAAEQSAVSEIENKGYANRVYARLNAATFTYNNLFVSPIISAAEVHFLLAEAYQQGYASGGNVKDEFKKAILESYHQYFELNSKSDQSKASPAGGEYLFKAKAEDQESDADVLAFAEDIWNSYSDEMEAIMTQKWAHFGIIQAPQAWTDIRRTGYPDLTYPTDSGSGVTVPGIVQRVKYPNTEGSNNTENYNAAKGNVGGDSRDFVLFWAKKLE